MARGNGPLSAEHEPYVVAEVRVAAGAGAGSDRAERDERFYLASQWQLMWRKFRRHRLAIVGGVTVLLFYGAGICAGFLSPNDPRQRFAKLKDHPPMRLRFVDTEGSLHLRPFVYRIDTGQDPDTWEPIFVEDTSTRYPVRWFSRGWEYRLWGPVPQPAAPVHRGGSRSAVPARQRHAGARFVFLATCTQPACRCRWG